jgi:hypothetical protein
MRTVKLHIGKHKTGTTSFQNYLKDVYGAGGVPDICLVPRKLAIAIVIVCMRDEVPIPPQQTAERKKRSLSFDSVKKEFEAFKRAAAGNTFVISTEHLSYFRTDEEIMRLRSILGHFDEHEIYLALRDKLQFLESYRKQLLKTGHSISTDRTSAYYCEADSWLADDESIMDLWRRNFGNITAIEYDGEDMVNRLASKMGLPVLVTADQYRDNRTDENARFGKFIRTARRQFLRFIGP